MGGADRQILYLTRALLANGYDARLVSMTPLGEMGRQAAVEGLPVTSLNMERGRADWRAFQQMVATLRHWRPHLLSSFMYHANLLARIAGKSARVPLIVTSVRNELFGSATRDWLVRLTNWMDDCCTTNSQQVADSLTHRGLISGAKLRVIPNGVDVTAISTSAASRPQVRQALGVAPDEFFWLAIGRLLSQKDYPTLLRAFQSLAQSRSRLAIAGRGPLLDALQQMAQQLGIVSQVSFLGVRHDVPALLTAADGFVLSSAWEGMPNVVMEALAAGTPVVATRVGGVSELVEPCETGFLVPPKDPPALAEAMRQLMSLPLDRRREMGMRGQHHVATRYSLEAMGERWMALYAELLTRKALPTPSPAQAFGSLR